MFKQKSAVLFLMFIVATFCYAMPSPFIPNNTLIKRVTEQTLKQDQIFLLAVERGDTDYIVTHETKKRLLITDKFGNNCFHLAKDVKTLQVLASQMRKEGLVKEITELKNQRNHSKETPLIKSVNEGKSDTFWVLYTGSDLANSVDKVNSLGASSPVLPMFRDETIEKSKDASGRTIAQAAVANQELPGMERVINFFQEKANYLF